MRSVLIFVVGVVLAIVINFVTDLFAVSDRHPAVRWWLLAAVLLLATVGAALSWSSGKPSGGPDGSPPGQVIHNAHGPVVGEISGGTVTFHQGETGEPKPRRR